MDVLPTTSAVVLPLRRRISTRGRRRRRRQRHRVPLPKPQQGGSRWLQVDDDLSSPSPEQLSPSAFPLVATGGSHFLTLAVGTPPQPQAVIIDTGSALMAFGCVPGCDAGCGTHTYPFFALEKSTTARTLSCGECSTQCLEDRCLVSQRYSEGSSWRAFSVMDRVGLGEGTRTGTGTRNGNGNGTAAPAIPFIFGCQTKLTYV